MWLTTILLGFTVALIVKWYLDRKAKFRYLAGYGILGPEPNFIFGNFGDLMKAGTRGTYLEWHKKYGKTFGYYEGANPIIATADLSVVKQILIKEFSNFHSRKKFTLNSGDIGIVNARGDDWKRQRMILSPTFSTGSIKEMSSLVNDTITKLLGLFHKKAKEEKVFNIMDDFQGLTLEAIATCGFGLDVDAMNNPDDPFLKHCRAVFSWRPKGLLLYVYLTSFLFPSVLAFFKALSPSKFNVPSEWFNDLSRAIIESRKESKSDKKDFINLMLMAQEQEHHQDLESFEVKADEDAKLVAADLKPIKVEDKISKGKGMSLKEMQASCMTFLLAGFETTSTTLSFLAYELARHPEIQQKVRDEVEEHFPGEKIPDYLSIQKLPYLEMVFSETLRLYPPAQVVESRECFRDTSINGTVIKKGTIVQLLVDAIHRDPEQWGPEDPEDFVPERFLPERRSKRDSLAWLPFGAGPRNCIGMRFAVMEVKMTIARVLKEFDIVQCEETEVPIKVEARGIARPSNGVMVKLVARN